MATYNADIRIGVVGKSSLNQLEAQLKRVNKQVDALQKSVKLRGLNQRISLDTRAAMTAVDALQRKISRLSQTVRVNLQTSEQQRAQSQGGSLGIATGGPSGQAAAAVARAAQRNTQELQKQVTTTKALTTATDDYLDAVGKAVQQNNKIAERLKEQERLREQLAKLENATNRRLAANLFGAGTTNEEAIKRTRKELNNVRSSLRGLQASQERYNKAVRDGAVARNQELQELAAINGQLRRNAQLENDALNRKVKGLSIDERIAQVQRRRQRGQNALRGAAAGAGAAAFQIPGLQGISSGAFTGAAVGGPVGAVAGAAVAAVLSLSTALTTYGASAAQAAQETDLLRKALQQVVGAGDYQEALRAIQEISDRFLISIPEATQQFTKLSAAARASGFSVDETKKTYEGLAAANLALGGTSQQLQGILLATTQVFSKGKVQAEELRGQIGERLAGAFAQFAEAVGKTPAELDKALERGEVSLEQFVEFTEFLLERYGDAADKLASEPDAAGRRLEKALSDLQQSVGQLLKPVLQAFQSTFAGIVEAIDGAAKALARFLNIGVENQIKTLESTIARIESADPTGRFFRRNAPRLESLKKQLEDLKKLRDGTADGIPLNQQINQPPTGPTEAEQKEKERQDRLNAGLRIKNEFSAQYLELQRRSIELTDEQVDRELARLEFARDIALINNQNIDSTEKFLRLRDAELKYEEKLVAIQNNRLQKQREAAASLQGLVNEIANQGLVTDFDKVSEAVAEISPGMQAANQAGNELFRTFENLIFATKNWTDVLTDALKALSSLLIRFALGGLAGGDGRGLFSFLNGSLSPGSQTSLPGALSNQTNFSGNLGNVGGTFAIPSRHGRSGHRSQPLRGG